MALNGQGHTGETGDLQTTSLILVIPPEILNRRLILPVRDAPSQSPWLRFTGMVPSCASVRPIGCRVYL
eukprot:930927-Pleurochrysis_carterae.AAC.2